MQLCTNGVIVEIIGSIGGNKEDDHNITLIKEQNI